MSVTDLIHFDKDGSPIRYPWLRKLFLSLVIILVATLSFGIGRLTGAGKSEGIKVEYDASLTSPRNTASVIQSLPTTPTSLKGDIVASKNGSKYHFSHCAGAKQIKEENKITFASTQDAEASGYTLASNCKPR